MREEREEVSGGKQERTAALGRSALWHRTGRSSLAEGRRRSSLRRVLTRPEIESRGEDRGSIIVAGGGPEFVDEDQRLSRCSEYGHRELVRFGRRRLTARSWQERVTKSLKSLIIKLQNVKEVFSSNKVWATFVIGNRRADGSQVPEKTKVGYKLID